MTNKKVELRLEILETGLCPDFCDPEALLPPHVASLITVSKIIFFNGVGIEMNIILAELITRH